ncbi:MAG: hypothetical protein QOE36_404 [Gaiellaceae bacterium]|jgi:hypothetical protein|nr:hypothetical protein [Gaiellaceae bacterium]
MFRKLHVTLAVLAVAIGALVLGLMQAPSAGAALVIGTYSHSDPLVTCEIDYNASNQITHRSIAIETPALNTPRSQQQASYQPMVYRWNGSVWAYDNQLNPIGGFAAFNSGNNLGVYMGGNGGFTVYTPGYYRIAIRYQWYWNGVVERSQFNWAGVHKQFFTKPGVWGNGSTGDWCYIP